MRVNESDFDNCISRLGHVTFEQDKGWRVYQESRNIPYLYFVDDVDHPNMACCGRVYKKPFVGRILDIVGEVCAVSLSEKVMKCFYKSLIDDSCCDMITYNSKAVYSVDTEVALRRVGFNRPLGSRTCPLTIFVDLVNDNESKRDRNWRRNVKKAVESNLTFRFVENPTKEDATIVCRMFDEMSEKKQLGYSLEPDDLYKLITNSGYRLYYVCREGRPICARIVYLYKGMAEDVFAANSNESREYSATHFMMDSLFSSLKDLGATVFDFSRIPPSNNETDSVYAFKKACGGYTVQYLGEWIWAKNKNTSLLFAFYNFYYRKAHHY